MENGVLLLVLCGAGVAGVVAGMTGLGTALTALAFWLHVMDPIVAVPLAAAAAVTSHLVTLTVIRHGIVWSRLWPFLVAGLLGLPLGVHALAFLDADMAKAGLGVFLILYCGYGLLVATPPRVRGGGRAADGAVGLAGGFLGGFAGVSGPLPTIWSGLRGWPKDEQRGVFQPFNLVILTLATLGHGLEGRFTPLEPMVLLATLAVAAAGAWIGVQVYRRVSDFGFRRAVLTLLLIAGLSHVVGWLA
jgi:uncharacterized membrane protein YfcA